MIKHRISNKQSGQMLLLAVIVVGLVLANTLVILSGSQTFFNNTTYVVESAQALNLAEAGVDKALASLNASAGTYSGENETVFGAGSFSTSVTSKDPSTMVIQSTGYIPNKDKPRSKRTIKVQASKGVGLSFVYGMLIGEGGITMGNGSSINGSLYSNGNVVGGNNELISGDVFVAGGVQPSADQSADCEPPNCTDFIFGTNISGNDRVDVAQSFKPSSTAVISKVSLKLKKIGTPANLSVKLTTDNNGKPNKNGVLASGILPASLVSQEYGFVDVAFGSNPSLTADTPYWIIVDASLSNSNYWSWSQDSFSGYTRGSAAWSNDWQAGNPTWNNINGDLGLETFMGGLATYISMNNGSIISGNVHANTISGITVNKDAYYQVLNNSIVQGSLYPNSVDPPTVVMPISSSNINTWKAEAESYQVTTGDINGCPASIGPGKIVGNLTTTSNCTIMVKSPVWITGNVTVLNSVIFQMDPSYGQSSGIIITDGLTTFDNGDDLKGTGEDGSYLTLLSTYDSRTSGTVAVNTGNSSITGILYAPYGIISLANNATFKEVVAWKINMGTGTILTYDTGLISTFFSSGPNGSFVIVKGTYQVQ